MYLKVYKDHQSSQSYIIQYRPNMTEINNGKYWITNRESESFLIDENVLYDLIDTYFKAQK